MLFKKMIMRREEEEKKIEKLEKLDGLLYPL